MRTRSSQLVLASGLAALLTACGGSGGGSLPATTFTPAPTTSSSPASQTANVQFAIAIPALPATGSARTRSARPMDFSAATQSVKVAIGTNVLTTSDVSATSSICKAASGGGRTCTIGVNAPTGNDQFTIIAYDQPNGAGNPIAQGTVGATVSSQASTVNVTVSGTIAKIAVSLSNPYPPVGTATTVNVAVTGYDVDGSAVLGAYPSAVTLSSSDTSGATSLSATTVANSTTPVTLNYTGATPFGFATITASLSGVPSATTTFAPTPAFQKLYAVPQVPAARGRTIFPGIWNMAKGPDGNMWVVTVGYSEIIKVAPDGTMTSYPLPSGSGDRPTGMVVGSDGNLWFAETGNNSIAKITTSGVVTEYPLPHTVVALPNAIALGSDGNIWFADSWNKVIGKITTSGAVTEYPEPSGVAINGMTSGPDGNLWITDGLGSTIQKVSTSGQFLASYALTAKSSPQFIVTGPDGNLWFTEFGANKIGRITPSGTIAEFNTPSASAGPWAIVPGPDGRMWYSEIGGFTGFGKIGYITVDGSQNRDFFGDGYKVHDLAFDSHGTLWYLELTDFRGGPENIGTFAY